MNKVIYKYSLPCGPFDSCDIPMPRGAAILSLQAQYDAPVIWAEFDPQEKEMRNRTFKGVATGREFELPTGSRYIGTYQQAHGHLVWHVYEITKYQHEHKPLI